MKKSTNTQPLKKMIEGDLNIFKSLFENSLNGILYGNPVTGDICDANPAAASMFGYSIEELITLNRSDVFDVNHPTMINSLKTRNQDGQVKGELIGIRKDGEHFPIEFTSSVFVLESGEQRTTTILNDITERKKAEEEINLFLNNTEETFLFIDREFKIVYFNKRFNDSYFLNYKKHAIKGESIFNYAEPERKGAVVLIFNKVLNGESYEDIIEKPLPNGKSLFFHVLYKPAFDFLNNVKGIFISTRDITEQKVIEKEMKLLLDNTEESFVFINKQLLIVSFNKKFESNFQYFFKANILKGVSILNFAQEERKSTVEEIYQRVFNGETIEAVITAPNQKNNLSYFNTIYKPALDNSGNIIGAFVTSRDIAEKRRAIQEKEFEQRNRDALINTTNDLIWSVDREFKLITANQAFIKTMKEVGGFDLKSGDDLLFKENFDPDFIAFWKQMYIRGLSGESFNFETQTPKGYPNVVYLETTINPIYEGNEVIGIACYSRDITELKNAHSELKTSYDLFEKLTLKLPTAIFQFEIDINGKMSFPYMSKGMNKLNPSINLELLKSDANSAFLTVHPDDIAPMRASIEHSKNTLTNWEFEYRSVISKDEFIWMKGISTPEKKEDGTVVWYGYFQDITEKRSVHQQLIRNEQEIKDSHRQLTKLTESVDTVVYQFEMTKDNKMTFPFISKGVSKLIPGADIELLKQDATAAFAYVHPKDIGGLIHSIYESRDTLSNWNYEYRSVVNAEKEIWIKGASHPELKENGIVVWYGYFLDITERKIDIEKLREANERYDIIAKATNDTIWDVDIINNTITWSEGIKLVYGYTDDEPNINNADWWYSKIHPDDIKKVKKQNELWVKHKHFKLDQEYRFLCANGSYKYILDRGFMLLDNNGTPIRITGAMQDITERKNSEKVLEKTLSLLNKTSELAKIGGWEVNLIDNTHYWSPEIYRIWELEENFIPTIDNVLKFFSNESKSIVKNAIKNGIEKGLDWNIELKAITANGKLIDVKVQGSAIIENKKTIKILGTLQDITEQKIAERKLRASELRFKTIFDAEPECVKLIDANGNIVEINKAGIKIHEAESEEQIKAIPIANFILPEYQKAFFDLHKNTMAGNHGFLEFEILGLKGTKRWLEAHSAPIYDAHKNVSMMLSVTRDITERKNTEKALNESQKRFKTIFETVPECVKLVNAKGDVIEINDAGLAMLEVDSIDSVNACRLSEFVLPKYQNKFSEAHKNAMNGKKDSLEFEIKGLKGTHRWLETNTVPMFNADNKVEMMLAVTRDVTQYKKEEHFLKLLESVITNTNDSVMVTEIESKGMFGPKIVYVNDAFTRMTGYTPKEALGKSPRILQGPNSNRQGLKNLSASMSSFKSSEITIINYKKSGEEFWVNFSVSPLADKNGNFTHWIAVGRDVTKNKNDDFEKEQIIAELSQNNKDLKQFSYVTSHNLRAPIANLLGLTSLIDHYKVTNKSLKQILDGVRKSALMFDDTVKDLTKVLVIKDQTNIIKENVSFTNVIDNVLKQLSISVDDNDVKVNYEFDNAPFIQFTTAYLESIFLNLFTNSIKYKAPTRKLKIDISSNNLNDFVILKFKDNGIGIDTEKHKEKLFKLYQRFHDNPDGKGLGLYLIKSQIEALGGSISVESTVGKGTTFIMKFKM